MNGAGLLRILTPSNDTTDMIVTSDKRVDKSCCRARVQRQREKVSDLFVAVDGECVRLVAVEGNGAVGCSRFIWKRASQFTLDASNWEDGCLTSLAWQTANQKATLPAVQPVGSEW